MGILMCFLGAFMIYACSVGGGYTFVTSPMNSIMLTFIMIFGMYLFIPVFEEVKTTCKRDMYINPPPTYTSSWQDFKNLYKHRNDEKEYQKLAEKVLRKRRCLTDKKKEIFNNPSSSIQDKYNIQQQIYEFDKLYQLGKFKKSLTKEEKQEIYQAFIYCQNKQGYWFDNFPIDHKRPLVENKLYMFYFEKQNEMYKIYGRNTDYKT